MDVLLAILSCSCRSVYGLDAEPIEGLSGYSSALSRHRARLNPSCRLLVPKTTLSSIQAALHLAKLGILEYSRRLHGGIQRCP